MSSFLERIRERNRRANAKRAKHSGLAAPREAAAPVAEQLVAGTAPAAPLQGLAALAAAPPVANNPTTLVQVVTTQPTAEALAPAAELGTEDHVESPPADAELEGPAEVAAPRPDAIARVEFAKSSNVRAAALAVDGVLTVEFRDGATYRYANFTLELMAEWEAAKSAGSWFHYNVRTKPDRHPVVE